MKNPIKTTSSRRPGSRRATIRRLLLAGSALCLAVCWGAATAQPPKNVIIMISDGCGFYHFDAASIYQYGRPGTQVYDLFPYNAAVSTYVTDDDGYHPYSTWNDFDHANHYYGESAGTSTSISTGIKGYTGGIGMNRDMKSLEHIAQRLKRLGKATGVCSSVPFSHATPAAFSAHNKSRGNFSEIAREMLLDGRHDVIIGCGNPGYNNNGKPVRLPKNHKYVGGREVWKGIRNGETDIKTSIWGKTNSVEDCDGDGQPDPWTLIESRGDFQRLMTGETPKRLLGVPQVYQTLQYKRDGDRNSEPFGRPFIETVPTLVEMAKVAINTLDNDPDGFFLMIEGGAVDWAAHKNDSGRMIEEQIDFNKTVEAVVDWIGEFSTWNETLLIVTADHECGYLTGPGSGPGEDGKPVWNRITSNGPHKLPGMQWNSTDHTNSLVPIFAGGAHAAGLLDYTDEQDPVRGPFINNSEIGQYLFQLYPIQPLPTPENIIFLVPSGAGYNHFAASRMYLSGDDGRLAYDSWPVQCAMSTWDASCDGYGTTSMWNEFDFALNHATSPAAAANALSCGRKTFGSHVGLDYRGHPTLHLIERTARLEKGTGLITSGDLSGPAIAGFAAHHNDCQDRRAIRRALESTAQIDLLTDVGKTATLAEVTRGALLKLGSNSNGFFLMVEHGGIAEASREHDSSRLITEMEAFNATVDTVIEWVERFSDWEKTLVVITGGYECGYLLGPGSGGDQHPRDLWRAIESQGPGNIPKMAFYSDGPTNLLVPFFAKGAGAEVFRSYCDEWDLVRDLYLNNTEVAQACFRLWPAANQ
jgi:alkaline phosphatase